MRRSRPRFPVALAAALACVGLAGCGAEDSTEGRSAALPVALDDQEDPVCGMLVRDQSAPRGQVHHRDGTVLAFCSLGDLLVHLSAPSRHGAPVRIFVEVMEPGEDPLQTHTGPHAWLPAGDAFFVVGVPRRGIMGAPVLSYRDAEAAAAVARAHPGAEILDFGGLERWWRESH